MLDQRWHPGDSGILVVVFSQVRIPAGKFGLERLFQRTRHSCLFLNDLSGGWYRGLDETIDAAVSQALARPGSRPGTAPTRIIYYGSSMGGYGALRTALRRGDGDLHAFGTELCLGRPGSRSLAAGVTASGLGHDLPEAHPDTARRALRLYFGCFDGTDALNAARAADLLPQALLHCLASTHGSHDHLYTLNLIRRITGTFQRDPETELASKGLILHPSLAALTDFGQLFERFATGECPAPEALSALPEFDRNPGMRALAAEFEARAGQTEAALCRLELLEREIVADPVWQGLPKRWRKKLPLRRVEILRDSGDAVRARAALQAACTAFPVDDQMVALGATLGVPLDVKSS